MQRLIRSKVIKYEGAQKWDMHAYDRPATSER